MELSGTREKMIHEERKKKKSKISWLCPLKFLLLIPFEFSVAMFF
jgi:hypothetical protein